MDQDPDVIPPIKGGLSPSIDNIRNNVEEHVSTLNDICPNVSLAWGQNCDSLSQSLKLKNSLIATVRNSAEQLREKRQKTINGILDEHNVLIQKMAKVKDATASILQEIEAHSLVTRELAVPNESHYSSEFNRIEGEICLMRSYRSTLQGMYNQLCVDEVLLNGRGCGVGHRNIGYMKDYSEKLGYLERLLGISIHSKGGAIEFVLDSISQVDPSRRFSFSLELSGDAYCGCGCVPMVVEFEQLVRKLNNGLDLGLFVYFMRRAFKEASALM